MNFRRTILITIAATTLASPGPAAAAGVGGISVSPEQSSGESFRPVAFIDAATQPGASRVAGRLLVRNLEQRPLTVRVDAVDAVTASNLGYAYTVSSARARRHTRWIRLSQRRLTLPPRAETQVAVRIRPSAGARPGDYLSGISVETAGQRGRSSGSKPLAISASRRYVVGVQMRIPGPRRARLQLGTGAVKRFPAGPTFLVTARNSGNSMLKDVRGRLAVYRGGRRVAATPVGPGTLVTGTSARLQLLARRERPQAGTTYRIAARLRHDGRTVRYDEEVVFGKRQERTQDGYAPRAGGPERRGGGFPVALAIALGLAAVAAIAAALRRRRRTRARLARLEELERQLAAAQASRAEEESLTGPA